MSSASPGPATDDGGSVDGTKILVTGGLGLIGRAVVADLGQRGAEVTVFDAVAPAREPPDPARSAVRVVGGSITDVEAVESAVAQVDMVVHLAGIPGLEHGTAEEIHRVNAHGTFVVLDAVGRRGLPKAVYASSINANGIPLSPHPVLPSRYPWDEDEPAQTADAYSLSKAENELTAAAIARRYGVRLTGLRYPLVRDIGADQGATFARHIRQVVRGDPRRAAAEGWSYLDVSDAAVATRLALTVDTPPAPGILIAAQRTFLAVPTQEALALVLPRPGGTAWAGSVAAVPGRDVPLVLRRSRDLLGFTARTLLEELDAGLLVAREELVPMPGVGTGGTS